VGGQTGVEDGFAALDPNNPPELLELSGNLGVHDPVVMEQDGIFYLFATGGGSGLNSKTSSDLRTWQGGPSLLSPNPSWISGMVPGVGNLWAPDIAYFGGIYHLYYSASTFGENRSCIGHATKASLSQGDWEDQGMVICSNVDSSGDNWNAIDPNIVIDETGTPFMSFGSFWGGLKLVELDAAGSRANDELHSIAARPSNGGALEAPFIVRRGRFYYLFMSWDRCCQGTSSTYNIRVTRSEDVLGPYVDADGTEAMQGGGTLVLEGDNTYHGPGHNAVLFTESEAFLVYHAYPNNGGVLRISEMFWDDAGWPVVAGP
jgi:arabinan endo-1,5-alpha-L-arabinosidase